MLFNSFDYIIFLPIVFLLYWYGFRKLRWQNLFILAASYYFYGSWKWKFLYLIIVTSLCSYASGILIGKYQKEGKERLAWWVSAANIIINLTILGIFKYYNFFYDSAVELLGVLGIQANPSTLRLMLPVGISFYTFQALGYSIDVYKRKVPVERNVVDFCAFLSFFPQLVAGPIESAKNLLPQFKSKRTFDYALASDGMRQILWGLFKKMLIADNCATVVTDTFTNYESMSGLQLLIGSLLFSFQIYGDFSGYSDIAIGSAKLFGFRLVRNFHTPYFSRDIAEFWNRWHISLMNWFRDYIYFPLGGNRRGRKRTIFNILVVYLASGLWHGANWTFVLWGGYNGLLNALRYILPGRTKHRDIVAKGKWLPSLKEFGQMWGTFVLAVIGWTLFRAESITHFFSYMEHMLTTYSSELTMIKEMRNCMYYILFMQLVEWLSREREHGLCLTFEHKWERVTLLRWIFYFALSVFVLLNCGVSGEFIYFQF